MVNPESLHDDEWRTGWKADSDVLTGVSRFRLIAEAVMEYSPANIFDLGCGDGTQAGLLKEVMPEMTVNGCDISKAAVEKGSRYLDSAYTHNIDSSDLPEENEFYNMVLCIAVLEHLYDVGHALMEIYRILKPGGLVVVQVPNASFWRFRLHYLFGRIPDILKDPRHLQSFNRVTLVENLQGARFSVIKTFGDRNRLKILAALSPGLFSEDLFVVAMKEIT